MEFKKATLQEVSSKPAPNPQPVGEPITVQINPATLRLTMANNVDMGKAFARPNTQYQGSSSSTLAFDLVFDTADEGTTEQPVDVRTRTRQLEKFLLPSNSAPKAVPPRVQFTYGTLILVGVMSALNVEFDYFALNGVPLRAKCAVTIKEQKPEFDAKLAGPGANTGSGATPPLPPSAGGAPAGPPSPQDPDARTGTALDGESASDFANRMGLDPRAWKGLAAGLTDPLRLEAGLQIDFSASLSLDVGLGVQVGATASLSTDGARPAPGDDGPVPAQAPATGAELTAQGGLSRALDRASVARTTQAAASSRAAFSPPAPAPAPTPAGGATADPTPSGPGSPPPSTAAIPAAAVVTADPRAVTFGFGVPLRERRGVAATRSIGLVHERARSVVTAPAHGLPETDDPTIPGWEALPVTTSSGARAGSPGHRKARMSRRGGCGCGCGGAAP